MPGELPVCQLNSIQGFDQLDVERNCHEMLCVVGLQPEIVLLQNLYFNNTATSELSDYNNNITIMHMRLQSEMRNFG